MLSIPVTYGIENGARNLMANVLGPRKVLLLEFNEITRRIIDPLIAKGKLPNLARLFRDGASAAPMSVDHPPHLDPWVTWVTLHTGVETKKNRRCRGPSHAFSRRTASQPPTKT